MFTINNNELTKRYCPVCGAEVEQNQKFCTNCGTSLIDYNSESLKSDDETEQCISMQDLCNEDSGNIDLDSVNSDFDLEGAKDNLKATSESKNKTKTVLKNKKTIKSVVIIFGVLIILFLLLLFVAGMYFHFKNNDFELFSSVWNKVFINLVGNIAQI